MIEFKNVSKKYKLSTFRDNTLRSIFSLRFKNKMVNMNSSTVFYSLNNVCFQINKGDCVGILGRNGAGKSTILKLISKVTLPSSGEIILSGRVSSLLEVGSGFHPDLSGMDNIFLSGAILGMTKSDVQNKVAEITKFAGIGDFIQQPVKYYSMGMSLRLAFSIGISLDSEILVIDEALAVGDANFQKKCIDKLNFHIENGKTIIFVSHDVNQVKSICNKSIVLDKGELTFFGDVEKAIELYNNMIGS